MSFLIGKLVCVRRPRALARFALRQFVRFFSIDVTEAESDLVEYDCIGDFFTRALKPGVRTIEGAIVSPVDGIHRESAPIQQCTIIQAKGKAFSIARFLGDTEQAEKFCSGSFSNLYLSPRHYHRVHAPVSGTILSYHYIPGTLWPVNDWSIEHIPDVFCVNERVITYIASEFGLVAVVMVGATNVGQMTLAYDSLVTNQHPLRKGQAVTKQFTTPPTISAGDPLGIFHMGSTVVVLFEKIVACQFDALTEVRMGQNLANTIHARD